MTSPVTIVGAGIFGLSAAFALTRRGQPVHVIEARRIGAGASGGHVGALAPHAPENWNEKKALQLDSLMAADRFWAEVEAASGLPSGHGRTGRLQPVPDAANAERLLARVAAASTNWPKGLGMRLTDRPEGALVPHSPTGLWLHDDLTARLNPRAACASLAAAIRARGGRISEGVAADPQILDAPGPVIWASGAEGLARLSDDLGRKLGQGVKGQSALLAHEAAAGPQVFADGLHIVPHADGTVAIGSTSENSFDHEHTDHQVETLIARARALCPALAEAPVLEVWAGIRPRAQSRAPVVAPWPGRPGHVVLNGGFKIGFGMAPLVAELAAALALDPQAQVPQLFRLP